MTGCERFQGDLKAYCDNELPMPRRFAVRRHLAGCASCRQEVSLMEQLSADLRAGDTGSLDPALRAKILTSVADSRPTVSPTPKPQAAKNWRPALAWGAGLLICIVVFGVMSHRSIGPRSSVETPKSQSINTFMAKIAGEAGPNADLNNVDPEDRAKFLKQFEGAPIDPQFVLKKWIEAHPKETADAVLKRQAELTKKNEELNKISAEDRAKYLKQFEGAPVEPHSVIHEFLKNRP